MPRFRSDDTFHRIEWGIIRIILILLLLIAAYKLFKVELPGFPWPF
jgi:hypothetical protein